VIIGKIVNVILSLLGVIFLLLVLYAGFLWMTAAGDEKKVGQAKNILSQAVVGLIIIVAGYAISNFVLDSLVKVTS
jgi:TRAP-type C4-dicarboxylate transport system permease small subunit